MQAVESQTLILYHTDLRGQWPEKAARALAARLPYLRRLAVSSGGAASHASLAGVALALRALSQLLGRAVSAGEIVFARGEKPRLALPARLAAGDPAAGAPSVHRADHAIPDFSIAHSGPWVGCAALGGGSVGLDIEMGIDARIREWVVREALLKASGEGLRAVNELRGVELSDDSVRWRGRTWQVRRLEQFAGAAACVLTSRAVTHIDARSVALAELFAP